MTQLSSSETEVTITGVAHGGDGIGRIDNLVCFVAGALPGEVVQVHIYRKAKNALWGQLLKVIKPSESRISNPACSGHCCKAACLWHDFAYPDQGHWKQKIVTESIRRIGGIEIEVPFVENQSLRTGYRTRAVFHGDGKHMGYYAPRTHDVIPLSACPLNHERLNQAFVMLEPLGLRANIHVTVNPKGAETLVCMGDPTREVRELFPMTNSFNDRKRHRFLFDGIPIINGAFSQASLLLNRMLRKETDTRIGNAEQLLDLYCGSGNLSLHHTKSCKVVGIDHAKTAIDAANAIAPGAYQQGDERAMATLIRKRQWDVILLDPPRTGAKALVESLAASTAQRIIYVSCNPATFARDAGGLVSGGWHLISAAALDMFPHTPHVETIGVFEKK